MIREKAAQSSHSPTQGSSLSSALSEAQSIVAAAEKRAEEIRADATNAFEAARQEGYQQGIEEGRQAAAETAYRLLSERAAIGEVLAEEAAKLALAIAGNVIGEHVKVDPEVVRQMALQTLRETVVGESAVLVVNPDDRKVIEQSLRSFRRVTGGAAVSVETDPLLGRGGCIVRTEFGEVDASIEALLAVVAAKLGVSTDDLG